MALNYLFTKHVPIKMVLELLKTICASPEKEAFRMDNNAYKKMLFLKLDEPFLKTLEEYYHLSKRFYLHRESYKSFMTVLRQILKSNSHPYTVELKWSHSEHEMVYWIKSD
jgi:hypothetical protein